MWGSKKSIAIMIVMAFVFSAFGSMSATSSTPVISVSGTEMVVTTPNGGEIYDAGSVQTIQWTSNFTGSAAVDPVGHWKLDEQSGIIAYDAQGSHDGDNFGAEIGQAGASGNSYYFDGVSDYVRVPNDPELDFTTSEDFSVYAWINTTAWDWGRVVEKRKWGSPTNDDTGYLMVIDGNGALYVGLDFYDTGCVVVSPFVVADGNWHHVGMVRDGDVLEGFVDGVSIGTSNGASSGDISNTNSLFIGTDRTIGYFDYTGYIDDVIIFDQAVYPYDDNTSASSVDIYYSINNGADWSLISSGEENDGSYDWTTPTVNSDQCLVKIIVTDAESQIYEDVSDGVFSIQMQGQVDLSISDNDISFSNDAPVEGAPVTIEAIIQGDQSMAPSLDHYGRVLPIGGFGEDLHITRPSVMKNDDGSYVMWYSGDANDGLSYRQRVFRAISPDGINWTKTGLVLDYGGAYMEYGVFRCSVLKDDAGLYHMWNTGVGYSGGYRGHIHYATSTDGITWVKEGLEFTYGEVYQPDGVSSPAVYFDGTEWHMWYQGVSWGPDTGWINYAHKSNIADNWILEGTALGYDGHSPYDDYGVSFPQVLPTDSGYEMYYTGRDIAGVSRILRATSVDGMSWTRDTIILEADPAIVASVASSYIMNDDGLQKIWYTGYDNTHCEIYYAEKTPGTQAKDATCTVSFYLDSIDEANLIDRMFDVFVPADSNTTLSTVWVAEGGAHDIIVDVTDVTPSDTDLSNNVASSSIIVQTPLIATATATGPQGAYHDPLITLIYTWTDSPVLVDMFYSNNNGDSWNYIGTDNTIDGTFDWIPDVNSGPKPSKYYWIANARGGQDDVGIPVNNTDPEAGPFNWKTFDLNMNDLVTLNVNKNDGAWYFVSTPLAISGDVITIFNDETWGDEGSDWDIIMWYDPTDTVSHWKSHNKNYGGTQSMPDVDNTMGVWVHITRNNGDGSLTIGEGVQPVSTIITLHAGWNMVGYPSQRGDITVAEAFWGTGADMIEVFDQSQPYLVSEIGPGNLMQPGQGYWVHVPVDTVWVVDW